MKCSVCLLHAPVQALEALLAPLVQLRRLTLWHCDFHRAPATVFSLPALEYLSLFGCSSLTSLDAGTGLTCLTKLCLNGCGLKERPQLAGATRLEELEIKWLGRGADLKPVDIDCLLCELPSLRNKDPCQYYNLVRQD